MAQKFTVPVTIKNLSSAGSDGITVFLDQESFARLKVEAGGRITWGDGSGAGDTNLYRDSASVLKTDDTFKSAGLFVAGTEIDTVGATVGDALVFNGTKFVSASVASGGGTGNASLTVSDTPPAGAEEGDLWFESDSGKTFVYYDSFWVEVGSGDGSTGIVDTLGGLYDVGFSTLANGDFLRYSSSASVWTNDAINLSTDTIGDYVQSLVAGTGVAVSNNSGEATTPTISIGQAVGTSASVQFAAVTAPLVGNASTASTLQTSRAISLNGDLSGSASFNGSSDVTITATVQPNSISLGTDTTGNYISGVTASTGVTVSHTPGEGSTATISIGQPVSTSSSVTFAGITNTSSTNLGTNTFAKTTVGVGEIAIDNGTTDSPGMLLYHANNQNWGVDTFYNGANQTLRFVKDLNESGGAVKAYIDTDGNFWTAGHLKPASFSPGQVIKDTMLSNSEVTVVSTTAAATGSNVNFITYSYTPASLSSYLIVHIHISKYTMGGTTDDSWFSVLQVDGSEIAYGWQMVNDNGQGTSGRSGVLFPLTGRYTNSNTTAKTISVAARRDSADDSITIDNSSTAIWLRITEVAR